MDVGVRVRGANRILKRKMDGKGVSWEEASDGLLFLDVEDPSHTTVPTVVVPLADLAHALSLPSSPPHLSTPVDPPVLAPTPSPPTSPAPVRRERPPRKRDEADQGRRREASLRNTISFPPRAMEEHVPGTFDEEEPTAEFPPPPSFVTKLNEVAGILGGARSENL